MDIKSDERHQGLSSNLGNVGIQALSISTWGSKLFAAGEERAEGSCEIF